MSVSRCRLSVGELVGAWVCWSVGRSVHGVGRSFVSRAVGGSGPGVAGLRRRSVRCSVAVGVHAPNPSRFLEQSMLAVNMGGSCDYADKFV